MKRTLRVVLDTNVALSALLFRNGRLAWLVKAWQSQQLIPLVSRESVLELLRVLAYPKFKLNKQERDAILAAFLPHTEAVSVAEMLTAKLPACRAPEDLKFLALAQAAAADYLVTGDSDLLDITAFTPFRILSPDVFRSIIEPV